MKNWGPEQQITTLKYGAYSALFASGMFATALARNIALDLQSETASWFATLTWMFAVGFITTFVRLSLKNRAVGGWRELMGVYNEEFAKDVNRKANSNGFFAILLTLVPAYIIGDATFMAKSNSLATAYFNLSNFAVFLLTLSAAVWSITVLLHLRDEAGA